MRKTLLFLTSSPAWNWVWGMLVFLLPLTSVPFVVKLVRSDVVAAPSGLLLALLCVGWLLPRLILSDGRLPKSSTVLFGFVIIAIFATCLSFFYPIPFYKGQNPLSVSFSAILTLLIGLLFFVVTCMWNKSEHARTRTFQIINISGAIVLLWTFLQAIAWYSAHRYPEWMKEIQFSLSIGSLYRQRFVGFTLEPSWLAHQLNLLYLPWWFAASLTGYSVQRKFKFVTAERILFIGGLVALFLTLSRVGYGAFLTTVSVFALSYFIRIVRRYAQKNEPAKRMLVLRQLLLFSMFTIIAVLLIFILLFALSKLDYRMTEIFQLKVIGRTNPLYYVAEKLSLAARVVYWDGGFSIFNRFPLFGVGLGHAGFYLPEHLPPYAFRLIEVRNLIFRTEVLMNIKSLWIRILAESGLVGFAFFISWLIQCLMRALSLLRFAKAYQTLAWMGCFTLSAFALEGFSVDTFALPYFWVSLGLVCAAFENSQSV